jgi:hypothetical protein
MEATVTPLPTELTTPPVQKMYFVIGFAPTQTATGKPGASPPDNGNAIEKKKV